MPLALLATSAAPHAVPLVAQRILAGGLGALAGLVLLTGGILVGLTTGRWPGR